jgi:hypothetical protein
VPRNVSGMDYTAKDFRKGQRVQMHPATDLFMRGARYGTVTRITNTYVSVKLDKLSYSMRFYPRELQPVE